MSNSAQALELRPTQRSGIFDESTHDTTTYCLSAGSVSVYIVAENWDSLSKQIIKHEPVRTYINKHLKSNLTGLLISLLALIVSILITNWYAIIISIFGVYGFAEMAITILVDRRESLK